MTCGPSGTFWEGRIELVEIEEEDGTKSSGLAGIWAGDWMTRENSWLDVKSKATLRGGLETGGGGEGRRGGEEEGEGSSSKMMMEGVVPRRRRGSLAREASEEVVLVRGFVVPA